MQWGAGQQRVRPRRISSLDDDHYTYKLSWLDRLITHLDTDADPAQAVIVAGDFNIAPDDRDVPDPSKLIGATHVSQPERDRLAALEAWGLVDVFRQQHDGNGLYYVDATAPRGLPPGPRRMRIDLTMCSASVSPRHRVEWCVVRQTLARASSRAITP